MSFDQAAIMGLLACMFVVYALERFRVELVAVTGLTLAFLLGIVPVQNVFVGFSSPAVVTVVEVLLIVGVLARARVVERFARTIVARARTERGVLAVLCGIAAFVSIFMNNIGALVLMFPVALSVCSRLGVPPGRMLMALSFSTLLGGLCSLTGTPANLLVNDWRIQETGGGFGYFEMGLVGAPVALAGIAWLVLATPRIFRDVGAAPIDPPNLGPSSFVAEVMVGKASPLAGLALPEADRSHGLQIHGVIRDGRHVFARRAEIVLAAGDLLLVEADIDRLDAMREAGEIAFPGAAAAEGAESQRLEAVVMPDSIVIGSRIDSLESFARRGVSLLGLSSRRRRFEGRFSDLQVGLGDVLLLGGDRDAVREAIGDAGMLALTARSPARKVPPVLGSLLIFALGVLVTALELAPPQIAFGGVLVAMALFGQLQLRSALQDVNWTIIILLACMIPLGIAVAETGAANFIANVIVDRLPATSPLLVAAVVLLLTVALTPFVDNVSTVAVMSPLAAEIASRSGTPIEPLLVAVALGASFDFLTPFGHHNNAVVMGAAGYRFIDFPRLGLPLLVICVTVAIVGLAVVWI